MPTLKVYMDDGSEPVFIVDADHGAAMALFADYENIGTFVVPTDAPLVPVDEAPVVGSNAGIQWGTNGHPVQGGGPYAPMALPDQFSLIKGLGLTDYRIDLYEAQDHSTDLLQRLLDEGARQGIGVLPVIIPNFQSYGSEQAAYADAKVLAQTYASRFRDVKVWELGNEYELWNGVQLKGQGIYITDYDYEQYVLARGALRGLLDGMRAGNPAALGCINTSGHGHWGWTDELWQDGLRWDISGEHFYSDTYQDGSAVDIRCLHLECGETDKLQLLKDKYGKPIYLTEFNYWCKDGAEGGDKAGMADYLGMAMAQYDGFARQYGVERVHIYELLDEPQAPGREGLLGLCSDGRSNVAGDAVTAYLAAHPSVVYGGR